MIVFAFLAFGHLTGGTLAGLLRTCHADQRAHTAVRFGTIGVGAAAGLLILTLAGDPDFDALHALRDTLRPVLGDLAEPLTAALLPCLILASIHGFCVAIGYLVLVCELGLALARRTEGSYTDATHPGTPPE